MKKLLKYPLIVLFLLVISLPVANDIVGFWNFSRKEENRVFKDDLKIRLDRLDHFPQDCENYIQDNFSFRTPILNLFHKTKHYVYRVSPNKNKMIWGKENWFFMAEKEQEEVQGKIRFNDLELNKIKKEWLRRKEYLEEKKIKFYWVIAPFKHSVYPEYLPEKIVVSNKQKRVNQLKAEFKQELAQIIIDPTEQLLKEKKENQVYAKMDNHWNFRAGKIVTQLLLDKMRQDFPNDSLPSLSHYSWRDTIIKDGNHYNVMNIKSLSEIIELPNLEHNNAVESEKYGYLEMSNYPHIKDYEQRFICNKPKSKLRVLFIQDSFGNQLKPFIADYFTESLFIFDTWNYFLNETIIESYKPDLVVFLNLETHTDSYLTNSVSK